MIFHLVSTLPKDTEDNEMEEYAYAAPNLTSTTSTSSLIVSNTAKSRKPKTKVQQKFYSAAVKLEKSQSLSGIILLLQDSSITVHL